MLYQPPILEVKMKKIPVILSFLSLVIISLVAFGCQKSNPSAPSPNVAQTVYAIDTQVAQQQTAAAASYTKTPTATITMTFTSTASPNASLTAAAIGTSIAQQQTAVASIFTFTATPTVTPTFTASMTPNTTLTEAMTQTFEAQTAVVNGWTSTASATPSPTSTPTATVTPTSTPHAIPIQVFGSYGSGDGQFNWGQGNFTDPSAHILYVADSGNNRIVEFDTHSNNLGAYIGQFGSGVLNGASGICEDITAGKFFVADTGNNRVVVFDLSGNSVAAWGIYGGGDSRYIQPPEFNGPTGIWFYNGMVYVSDDGNNRVQVFDEGGNCTGLWSGAAYNPNGICIGSNGMVYICDRHGYIDVYDTSGNYQFQIGSPGNSPGKFDCISSIAIDNARGVLYATSSCNGGRIETFDLNGNFIMEFGNGVFSYAEGIAFDQSSGWLYVVNDNTGIGRIQVYFPIY
jgi:sugar lactone lactonase YvrE